MKIKEIDRTANVAWSPVQVDPIYLAVGTAAQQLDSSFSTNSALEIYQFDINQGGLDLPVKATLPCESRFHKLVWGSYGIGSGDRGGEHPSGIIIGGCDNGVMQVYDAAKILKNETPLVLTKSKHTGAVRALDFNPFRANLVASGASDSEIFIWDLTNTKTPMTPGTKVQPADDVSHLSWNKQVEHILASTFSTRCVVWDLRKNEPVIKVSDTTSRIRYKVVEWHPEVATQMCLASEDDNSPVIQLWDLRYATAPLKVIQGHQRGILGMAWCAQEPDLLLTCGKDAKILCWNPNYPHSGYELVCDIPTSSQFSFDVSFCPKNPIVVASSSYDGRVSIFGLSGGTQHPVTSSKLADSFPGMDLTMTHTPLPSQQPALLQLRDAPKWLKRPCGASFAFGGKLISFSNIKGAPIHNAQLHSMNGVVNISQLVTLPNLIERSKKLEETLQSGSLETYCAQKASESGDGDESRIWEFLQASFSQSPRQVYLSMLGFNTTDILSKLDKSLGSKGEEVDGLADGFEALGRGAPDGYANGYGGFPSSASTKESEPEIDLAVPVTDSSVDGKINQALLCGSIDVAVNLCLDEERWADALLLATKGSPELLTKAQNKYFQKCQNEATQMIRALVTHDLSRFVERSKLDSWKQVLAILITYADQNEFPILADQLGQRLQGSKVESQKLGALLCCICSGNLNHLVDVWVGDTDKHKGDSPDELQDLVEQVMILRKAGEHWGRESDIDSGSLATKLVQYSNLLASQGCLESALNFLGDSNDPSISSLRERLYYSLRYARPSKASVLPRSRQTSESRGFLAKRPSYPSTAVKRGSADVLNNTDFSNLTGPVHPPAAPLYGTPAQGPYGNIYVNSSNTVPDGISQYSPALSSGSGGNPSYGLPPRPPSTAPGSIYNPADATVTNNRPLGTVEPVPTRTPLGSSLPQPPVSSAAHGWNDPPPIKSSSKPKPTATATPSSAMPNIFQPVFGAPEPINPMGQPRPMDSYGASNTYGGQAPMGAMPPPPMQSSQSYYSPSPITAQPYGQPPISATGLASAPPTSYGPPPSQSSYGPPPPSQTSFGAPPPSQSSFGAPPPASFGNPGAGSFGNPGVGSFGGPSPSIPQNSFGVNSPPQSSFGPPTPSQNFGPPPSSNIHTPSASVAPVPQSYNQPYGSAPPAQQQQSWGTPPTSQPQPFSQPTSAPQANPLLRPSSTTPSVQPVNILNPSPLTLGGMTTTPSQAPFAPNPASVFQPIAPASAPVPVRPQIAAVAEPEPPKPKGPIPAEHAMLIETLEKLRSDCYEVAHLQQMKRKLEDVARKLEVFSDKLRSGGLSDATLNTLHNLVDAVKAHDYQQALSIHTQLVTAGNFAEISTFLPAIKVLIQSATQLGV